MRIQELLSEAISVSSYDKPIELAIKKSILGTLSELTDLYGVYKAAESDFNDYTASDQEFTKLLTMEYEQHLIVADFASDVKNTINQRIGSVVVEKIYFKKLKPGVSGQAPGRFIELSRNYLKEIAKLVIESLVSMTNSNFDHQDHSTGFFSLCEEAAHGNRYVVETINQSIYETVYKLVDTIIHELTHVLQHYPQLVKGKQDTEYRSYLDRKKGEFNKLHRSDIGDQRSERWLNLYYASPQEMAAFAHNAALYIIRKYGIHRATDPNIFYNVKPDNIIDGINTIMDKYSMGEYFSNPKTAKEQQIRNRYIKLVYMEVQKYIKEKLASLQKAV